MERTVSEGDKMSQNINANTVKSETETAGDAV